MADDPNAPKQPSVKQKPSTHLRLVQASFSGGPDTDTVLVFHPTQGELALLTNDQFTQLEAALGKQFGSGMFSQSDPQHCDFAFQQAKALAGARVYSNAQMSMMSHAMSQVITIGGWDTWAPK